MNHAGEIDSASGVVSRNDFGVISYRRFFVSREAREGGERGGGGGGGRGGLTWGRRWRRHEEIQVTRFRPRVSGSNGTYIYIRIYSGIQELRDLLPPPPPSLFVLSQRAPRSFDARHFYEMRNPIVYILRANGVRTHILLSRIGANVTDLFNNTVVD